MLRKLLPVLAPKPLCRAIAAALLVLAVVAAPAFAVGPGGGPPPGGGGGGVGGEGTAVPEINPGAAISALMLLAGGSLILTDRLRRRSV